MITKNKTPAPVGMPGRHRAPWGPAPGGGGTRYGPILPEIPPWVLLVAVMTLGLPRPAAAGLILNAEVRVSVEDNIVGLLSGEGDAVGTQPSGAMQAPAQAGTSKGFGSGTGGPGVPGGYSGGGSRSPGDFSVTAMAEAGGFVDRGDSLSFFAKGFAERTDYLEFSEYDQTAAGISAGMTAFLSKRFSAGIAGFDKVRTYDNDPDRDSTAAGGIVTLKQRGGRSFSFRQSAEYETSRATYPDFSYRGTACRVRAGYDASDSLLLVAGYGLQSRRYRDSDRTVLRTGTASLGADYAFSRHWNSALFYDGETTTAATTGIITRNNILTVSLRYSY